MAICVRSPKQNPDTFARAISKNLTQIPEHKPLAADLFMGLAHAHTLMLRTSRLGDADDN